MHHKLPCYLHSLEQLSILGKPWLKLCHEIPIVLQTQCRYLCDISSKRSVCHAFDLDFKHFCSRYHNLSYANGLDPDEMPSNSASLSSGYKLLETQPTFSPTLSDLEAL